MGAGIKSVAHITLEARGWIQQADIVLYCLAESGTEQWIRENARQSRNLSALYGSGKARSNTYREMAETALLYVRAGFDTCMIFYGHPGVFVQSTHLALSMALSEGFPAVMLPGISALDCLFADLGIEQATTGFQSVGATDLLLRRRILQTDCHLVIWQVGFVGNSGFNGEGTKNSYLPVLLEYLGEFYERDHPVTVYEASQYSLGSARKDAMVLADLAQARLNFSSTLYIPPRVRHEVDPVMVDRLGFRTASPGVETPVGVSPAAGVISAVDVPPRFSELNRSRLGELMAALAEDPRLLAQFNQSPRLIAEQYRLSADELKAALTHSSFVIHRAIAGSVGQGNQSVSEVVPPPEAGVDGVGLGKAILHVEAKKG